MGAIAILVAGALFVLAAAFGLHCVVLHCDRKPVELVREPDSA